MDVRRLGRSELFVPKLVFGSMWHGLQGDEATRTRLIHEAIDLGITAIDTAPLYEFGGSEEHLGRVLVGHRNAVTLLTKVGLRWDSDHGQVLFEATIGGRRRSVRRDSRPESIRKDVEESLIRLRTDRLDLVQVHHLDERTPIEATIGALIELRNEGKLRCIGVCNYRPADLRRAAAALGDLPLASAQEHYSLLTRGVEDEVIPTLHEIGTGLLAYSPLEQGALAGRLLGAGARGIDRGARGPLFHPRNARRINAALRESVEPIARAHGASVPQIALAWLLHRPGVSAVICGASTREQLTMNARASLVALTEAEMTRIEAAFAALAIDRQVAASPCSRAARVLRRMAAALRVRRRLAGR